MLHLQTLVWKTVIPVGSGKNCLSGPLQPLPALKNMTSDSHPLLNVYFQRIAAVQTSDGTHVAVIYDKPGDDTGGESEAFMKCTSGCNAGDPEFIKVKDDDDSVDSISQAGAKTITCHKW